MLPRGEPLDLVNTCALLLTDILSLKRELAGLCLDQGSWNGDSWPACATPPRRPVAASKGKRVIPSNLAGHTEGSCSARGKLGGNALTGIT